MMNIEDKLNEINRKLELQLALINDGLQKNAPDNANDEIDLVDLVKAIWRGKAIVLFFTVIFSLISIYYALGIPNVYRASVVLLPASNSNNAGIRNLPVQIGGLASLAGINLNGGSTDKTSLAIEILSSRVFIENFIANHNLMVPLMASKGWDNLNDQLVIDEQVYDINSKTWGVIDGDNEAPSSWEAFKQFSALISVDRDTDTGIVSIHMNHFSPSLAKEWLGLIVKDINYTMKNNDQNEAQSNIDYLTSKLEETKLSAMQSVFYQLIEEQTKTMMLAEVGEEYVLKTIDPPSVPDEKVAPKRALIVVVGTILGGILGIFLTLIRHYGSQKGNSTKERQVDVIHDK